MSRGRIAPESLSENFKKGRSRSLDGPRTTVTQITLARGYGGFDSDAPVLHSGPFNYEPEQLMALLKG